MAKNSSTIIILITTGVAVAVGYFLFTNLFTSRSEFDKPEKENPKIITMFDKQLKAKIEDYEQNSFHPGYLPTAQQHVASYLRTITKIESYSRYGVNSSRPHNAIEVSVTFKDGLVAEDLYTGQSSSHVMPPPLLISVSLENGKTTKVLTNGVEKKGAPEWIVNDLNVLIKAAIRYDEQRNRNAYYPPEKTKQDYEREWEEK